jgi:hypothetical protein
MGAMAARVARPSIFRYFMSYSFFRGRPRCPQGKKRPPEGGR